MRAGRRFLAVIFVAWGAALVVGLAAQRTASETELAELDARLQQAAVKGDADLLERHLSDDFVFTHSGGQRDTKADWVRRAKQAPPPYLARKVSDQAVEVHGDVALVTGRLDVQVPPSPRQAQSGPQCYALRYAHVYARRNGRWMFLSHQTMQMVEESHPCGSAPR
jgi:ketosteroid isomerase-like protein